MDDGADLDEPFDHDDLVDGLAEPGEADGFDCAHRIVVLLRTLRNIDATSAGSLAMTRSMHSSMRRSTSAASSSAAASSSRPLETSWAR